MNVSGVLEIKWSDTQYTHSGSGLLISKNGYAITNTHVVTKENGESCGTVQVRINGEEVSATVEKLGDTQHGNGDGWDLAIIKLSRVPHGCKVLKFEHFDNVRIGERVFVIGNSLGYGTCITNGIVSDKNRNVNGKNLLMTDCAVNGGNSGGPIFNDSGLVIGVIVSGISSAEGMNFAIPSNTVIAFVKDDLISTDQCVSGRFEGLPESPTVKCIYCFQNTAQYSKAHGAYFCKNCLKRWSKEKHVNLNSIEQFERKKALAPCPRCGSNDTYVENSIFVCDECGFEGG